MTKMVRLQLDMPKPALDEIEQLMEITGTRTKREYVNSALTLMKWAITQVRNGRMIASVDEREGFFRQLEMPIFDGMEVVDRKPSRLNLRMVRSSSGDADEPEQ